MSLPPPGILYLIYTKYLICFGAQISWSMFSLANYRLAFTSFFYGWQRFLTSTPTMKVELKKPLSDCSSQVFGDFF